MEAKKTTTIQLSSIRLDPENPRHDPITDERKIIEHLLKDEQVKNLASHIAKYGINPLEVPGVIKSDDKNYIVVEGNRRVCALKLLNDPELAPNSEKSYFERLLRNTGSDIETRTPCYVFNDLQDADVWLRIKHGGAQSGAGTKKWDAPEKARYNAKMGRRHSDALGLSILEYAEKYIVESDRIPTGIITTAMRYLGNPLFRQILHIDSGRSESNVVITTTFEEFDKVLLEFVTDLVENKKVTSRRNKAEVEDYAKELLRNNIAPVTKTPPVLLADRSKSEETESPNIAEAPDINTGNNSDASNGSDDDSEEVRGSNYEGNSEDETSHRPMAAPENAQASVSDVEGNVGEVKSGTYTPDPLNNASGESASNNSGDNSSDLNNNGQLPNANDQETAASLTNNNESKPRFKRDRRGRRYLIDWNMNVTNPRVDQIYRELKGKLVVDEMPNAAGIVFRVFLETSCDAFISAQDQAGTPVMKHDKQETPLLDAGKKAPTLSIKVLSVAKHQEEQLKTLSKQEHKGIRVRASANDIIGSMDYFHQLVHGTTTPALSNELKQVADVYAPLLKAIWPA